jgi:hypothetical protein
MVNQVTHCHNHTQVLLQLNLAFYLPSIPVLLAAGQLEKLLDAELGSAASLAIRLLSGAFLLCCCCALLGLMLVSLDAEGAPHMPQTHAQLNFLHSTNTPTPTGLAGCAAMAAYYPFMPGRLSHLLWLVAGLGGVSSVAFSTSYQLVAWFRCDSGFCGACACGA